MKRILLLVLLMPGVLFAEDVVVESTNGSINWTKGVVYAQGFGTAKPDLPSAQRRLLSRRAAIVDAQRNLLEMTKGVRITSMTRVVDMMVDNSVTASRVEGVVKGAVPVKEQYQNDIFVVTMAMPIGGELLQVVYEPRMDSASADTGVDAVFEGFKPIVEPVQYTIAALAEFLVPVAHASEGILIENESEAKVARKLIQWIESTPSAEVAEELKGALTRFESGQHSGLLIDASSVAGFELATVPRIRDEAGNVIYPSESTSYDDIVNKRGVTYDFDLQDAVRNQRVARVPLVVNALSTYKNLASDLVISKQDAARILSSESTQSAMNQAGVLIVISI